MKIDWSTHESVWRELNVGGTFQAMTMARRIPQPTNAGKIPSTGGNVKLARQPVKVPRAPSARRMTPKTKAVTAQIRSKAFMADDAPALKKVFIRRSRVEKPRDQFGRQLVW